MARRKDPKPHRTLFETDYYAWRTETAAVNGVNYTILNKAGMTFDASDVAARLLAENIEVAPHDTVLDLHCGAGLVGTVAAAHATAGHVLLADANAVAVEAAQRTVAAHALTNVSVVASSGMSHIVKPLAADIVTIRLPKGKLLALQLIWDGFCALKPGGRLYLAGANDEGIKTMLRHVDTLFGMVRVLDYSKGHRVGMAIKGHEPPARPVAFCDPWLDARRYGQFTFHVRGQPYPIVSRPGLFSWDGLDDGTARLLDTMYIAATDDVLDLGCGNGIVGVVAAGMAERGTVHLCDANITAVEAARRTVALNQRTNCRIHLSDCAAAVRDRRFDVVVTNPPFHQAKATQFDVANQFIKDAARLLKPVGRFYLVANQFIAYEERMGDLFGAVQTVFEDGRFKVLLAQKS